jgi:hypothetical protein
MGVVGLASFDLGSIWVYLTELPFVDQPVLVEKFDWQH